MFNERARFRLHHPIGSIPDLTCAPAHDPDVALAGRVAAAFRSAASIDDAGAVWAPLLREKQGQLEAWLTHDDTDPLASDLAALGRSEAAQGFFGGAGQHRRCDADPVFRQLLAAWTYDKLLSLAEALGVVRIELPENGSWGENPRLPAEELWERIQDGIGHDLSPPQHVGGYLGIAAGDRIIQMRVVEAIYAAHRLRQLVETRKLSGRICEIGAGAGLTAYYAMLLGLEHYVIVDLPTMNAVQGYMLAGSKIGGTVALAGEHAEGKRLRILPPDAFSGLEPGSIDILYNQDSLPEIEPQAALNYLRDATALRIPLLFSINQEAHLSTSAGHQRSVPELVAASGGCRASSRHRHWLRQGYVEETFERI